MPNKNKTWKREIAMVLLGFIFYLGFIGDIAVLEVVIWPFMLYVGGAYGMEWASKQTTLTTQRYE